MSKIIKAYRIPLLSFFVVVVLGLCVALPVLAYTYRASLSVSNNSTTTGYTMLPVWVTSKNTWMAANGFMNSTANDTRVQTLGGLNKPHMVADNKTLTANCDRSLMPRNSEKSWASNVETFSPLLFKIAITSVRYSSP